MKMFFLCLMQKELLKQIKDVRDGVMNEFVSWCRHLLVFHAMTSLRPPSVHRNDISTCIQRKCGCLYYYSVLFNKTHMHKWLYLTLYVFDLKVALK